VGVGVGTGAEGVGVGVGLGEGELGAGAAFFGFGFFCAGSDPDGVYDTTCGADATWAGLTAEGAAAFFSLPPLALPMPNAAPNATTAAIAPIVAARAGVIRDTSRACAACSSWGSGS
jgi:hypothetical protein